MKSNLLLTLLLCTYSLQAVQLVVQPHQESKSSFYKGLGIGIATGVAVTLLAVGITIFAYKKSNTSPDLKAFMFFPGRKADEKSFLYKAGEKLEEKPVEHKASNEAPIVGRTIGTEPGNSSQYYSEANKQLREARIKK